MAKGKDFEREVSVLFSLWLTGGKHDDHVWHTGSSGARGTVRKKNAKSASNEIIGDLAATEKDTKFFFDYFNVELKSGYRKRKRASKKDGSIRITNWSITDILDGTEKRPTILEFWDQAQDDAQKSGRTPMLVFRRNNRKACIAMNNCVYQCIIDNLEGLKWVINRLIIQGRFMSPITIVNLQDFLKLTRYEMTPKMINKIKEGTNG